MNSLAKWLLILFLLLAVSLSGAWVWYRHRVEVRTEQHILAVQFQLDHKNSTLAWGILRGVKQPDKDSPLFPKWFKVQAEFAIQSGDGRRLERLQKMAPDLFSQIPQGEDWLERLSLEEEGKIDTLLPRSPDPLITKADVAIKSGDKAAATKMLEQKKLEGDAEVGRLLRLAVLNGDTPATAWKYLQEAARLSPSDPDVRTYGALLLELSGDYENAQQEFAGALMQKPYEARYRYNLAGYYLRTGNPVEAIKILSLAPGYTEDQELRREVWMLNRVALSGKTRSPSCPSDADLPGLGLGHIPQGAYWSPELDDELLKNPSLAKQDRVLFCLRLVELLREKKNKEALQLLVSEDPVDYWSMNLFQSSLRLILGLRPDSSGGDVLPLSTASRQKNPYWQWLYEHQNDPASLEQPWVLPMLFVTFGWMSAASDLTPVDLPASTPDWALYSLTKACLIVGNTEKARKIMTGHSNPALELLSAEAALGEGKKKEAIAFLEKILDDRDVGPRASYLLCIAYQDTNQPDEALRVLNRSQGFADSVPGQELKARMSLRAHDDAQARKIYEGIVDNSDAAKLYLSKQAYLENNFTKAKELTQQLLLSHPQDELLLKNLSMIESKLALPSGATSSASPSPKAP